MDGALLVAAWCACSLLVAGVALVRGASKGRDPSWLVPTSIALGPLGIVLLVGWALGHRPTTSTR